MDVPVPSSLHLPLRPPDALVHVPLLRARETLENGLADIPGVVCVGPRPWDHGGRGAGASVSDTVWGVAEANDIPWGAGAYAHETRAYAHERVYRRAKKKYRT